MIYGHGTLEYVITYDHGVISDFMVMLHQYSSKFVFSSVFYFSSSLHKSPSNSCLTFQDMNYEVKSGGCWSWEPIYLMLVF